MMSVTFPFHSPPNQFKEVSLQIFMKSAATVCVDLPPLIRHSQKFYVFYRVSQNLLKFFIDFLVNFTNVSNIFHKYS